MFFSIFHLFFAAPAFAKTCRAIRPAGARGQRTLSIFSAASDSRPNQLLSQKPAAPALPAATRRRPVWVVAVLVSAKDQFLQNLAAFVNTFFRFPRFFFEAGSPPQDTQCPKPALPKHHPPHLRAADGSVHCRFSESVAPRFPLPFPLARRISIKRSLSARQHLFSTSLVFFSRR